MARQRGYVDLLEEVALAAAARGVDLINQVRAAWGPRDYEHLPAHPADRMEWYLELRDSGERINKWIEAVAAEVGRAAAEMEWVRQQTAMERQLARWGAEGARRAIDQRRLERVIRDVEEAEATLARPKAIILPALPPYDHLALLDEPLPVVPSGDLPDVGETSMDVLRQLSELMAEDEGRVGVVSDGDR